MGNMKMPTIVVLGWLALIGEALATTFTTADTFIPVPAQASGTSTGDTSAVGSNTIHLDARVYIPDGIFAPAPVIVVIHPYGGSKDSGTAVTLARDFASQGYVVLTPTARGFGNSEGLVSLAGPNEVNDLKTIILAMQTGVIGDSPAIPIPVSPASKFGVTGASYGGGFSFEIIRTHVAGLTAVAPIIGWTDLYQALSPNDVPKLSYTAGLFAGGFDPQHPNYDDVMFDWLGDFLGGHPEDARTGSPQQNIDWRSVIFDPAQLTMPTFVIQGWRDWLFPAEQAESLFETSTAIPFFKLYIGGLGHAPASTDTTTPEALFLLAQLVRWFDFWLKGVNTGITTEPRVTIGPENTANWSGTNLVNADTFPLPGTAMSTYFFRGRALSTRSPGANRRIALQPSTDVPAVLQPIQNALGNPTALIAALTVVNGILNSGGDILSSNITTALDTSANSVSFTSAKLKRNLHVVGLPAVHLFVSSTGTDADYYVQIFEVRARGARSRLVSRGAFHDHAAGFNTPHEIDFSPFSTNHLFKAGNKIRVQVSSRDFPFFLPNFSQPVIKIYRNANHPSNVAFPVVPF
jgi:ABC-2 type transport system ATP-binding protein